VTVRPETSMSVVVCTYTDRRWTELSAGLRAVEAQLRPGDELLVVVDHNEELLTRVTAELPGTVVASTHGKGLSGARNTGVDLAVGEVVAFLDDDALPREGWLEALRSPFADSGVTGVAGAVEPAWEGGERPRWFPMEFGWVVGCDYIGLAGDGQRVRNPIGASMALRRQPVADAGGFSELVGRVGALPVGCEETELSIRLGQRDPQMTVVRAGTSPVAHLVPKERQTVRYFTSRCYHEGRSKAVLSRLVGMQEGLAAERAYSTRTLPLGVLRHLGAVFRGDFAGLARAVMIVVGLFTTAFGYVSARRS
jgi:hypothetical protein